MYIKPELLVNIKHSWLKLISAYSDEALEEHINNDTYIPGVNIFVCFTYFDISDTKVVILGQDPYPTRGRADGLSFSFGDGLRPKDSLKNIFKELYQDLGIVRTNTKLDDLAKQGVLLLNCALSYINKDKQKQLINLWNKFINYIIKNICEESKAIFVLWGNFAKTKKQYISTNHLIIESSHPSNMGNSCHKGFFGSKPFSRINEYLQKNNLPKIKW